jgi:hypothetical protein
MGDFEMMYGCMPREYTYPLEKGDHSELDTTAELVVNKEVSNHDWMVTMGSVPWKI